MEKRNAGRRGYGTCLFASILVGRKYSRRSTLVLHRAIDTSQLKCDVCPLFKLYNVFCSPTRVERCWTAHEPGGDPRRKRWTSDMEIPPFSTSFSSPPRIRAEPSNVSNVRSPVMRRDYFETKKEQLERKHRSFVSSGSFDLDPLEIRITNNGTGRK